MMIERVVVRAVVKTRAVSRAVGIVGKSQYQSYLDTTTDDPPLSEAEWAAARSSAYQSATPPDPSIHPSWLNTVNGAHYLWYGTPPNGAWVQVSHEQALYEGLPIFTLGDSYAVEGGELCTVPTYTGANPDVRAGHPSVVHIPQGVSGYKYWMAHTPLKGSYANDENPTIVASNDGVVWETPEGLSNPIYPKPANGWNADVNLTWEGDRFVVLWNEWNSTTGKYTTIYKTSPDGVAWSSEGIVMQTDLASLVRASPSLRKLPDGTYQLWSCETVAATNTISMFTAPELTGPWAETPCTFSHTISQLWHLEVHYYRGQYIMLQDSQDRFGRHNLIWLASTDGITWMLNQKWPYAIGWNGDTGQNATYYKSSCVLGNSFGDGLVGRMWHTKYDFSQMRVTDLYSDSALNISETYVADSPLTVVSPYAVGDSFAHADGNLPGKVAPTGQTWLLYGNQIQVDAGKIKMGLANSYAAIETGVTDGMVGIRLSTLPFNGTWELEARGKRGGVGQNIKRVSVYFVNNTFILQAYNGAGTVVLGRFILATISDLSLDGSEVTLEFRDRLITARLNGRVIIKATLSESDAAAIAGQTQACIYVGDAGTRIDRFFAQS